jgi:hypothetical protein
MTTTGMSASEIDEIVARRRHQEMRQRRTRLVAAVVVLVTLSFALVPAMANPVRALRMQQRGVEAQAMVTGADEEPLTCDAAGCHEQVFVVFDLDGAEVPQSFLTADISALSAGGARYELTRVEHVVPSAAAASARGDTFPVWFVVDGQFAEDLTTLRPPIPFVSVMATWWWLLVPLLLVVLYPRIDAVVVRRRGSV